VETIQELRAYFTVTANDYWHYHYRFDEPAGFKEKKTGPSMVDSVIINTICPLLFAYGEFHNLQECKDKSLRWLGELNAEQNNIVRGFKDIGVKALNSFDTQALIELKTQYCDQKNCLSCGVGNWILKQV